MQLKLVLAIAGGGAVGAVARHLVMSRATVWFGGGFPWGTVMVNVLGSFILGSLIEIMALRWSASQEVRGFLAVGMMGAFTTFSTFSMDVVYLVERGQGVQAGLYVAGSVAAAIGAFVAGLMIFRQVLT